MIRSRLSSRAGMLLFAPLQALAAAAALAAGAPPVAPTSVADTTPPQLKVLGFSPAKIDTSTASAAIGFTLRLADDRSGVQECQVTMRSPSGKQSVTFNVDLNARISGDPMDGYYVDAATFPVFGEAGTWTIDRVAAVDMAHNVRRWEGGELETGGFPRRIEVVSVPDTRPPDLRGLSFTPRTIDTSKAAAPVTFTLRATDDLAGVEGLEIRLTSPSGKRSASVSFDANERISGDARDGTSVASETWPAFSEPGVWTIDTFLAADEVRNVRRWGTAELEAAGFPTRIDVVSVADTVPPEIKGLSLSRTKIDTSTAKASVAFTLRLADDRAGIKEAGILLKSPSGKRRADASFSRHELLSGDARNGVYVAEADWPRSSEIGTWTIDRLVAVDGVGNYRHWGTVQLEAMGLPTRVEVVAAAAPGPGGAR